jgi:hypothetical protein
MVLFKVAEAVGMAKETEESGQGGQDNTLPRPFLKIFAKESIERKGSSQVFLGSLLFCFKKGNKKAAELGAFFASDTTAADEKSLEPQG